MLIRHWLTSIRNATRYNFGTGHAIDLRRRQRRFHFAGNDPGCFRPYLQHRQACARHLAARRLHWGARQRLA